MYVSRRVALMVSPCCGYLCTAASVRVTAAGWDCPLCASTRVSRQLATEDLSRCCYCTIPIRGLDVQRDQSVLARDAEGVVRRYPFCKRHTLAWAKPRCEGYLAIAFIKANVHNKTGAGLVLDLR
jgi:hypothetical protein